MESHIRIYEVSPRDGLQNEPDIIPTDAKIALIERLVQSGFRDIEVTSFVSPRFIPQLADAAEVLQRLPQVAGVRYWALVPNPTGLERAKAAKIQHIATFLSSSETHNQKNVNRSIPESLEGLETVIRDARRSNIQVRGYISTVFGCPYEGDIAPEQVVDIALQLLDFGAQAIVLGDTTGMADPEQVKSMLGHLTKAGIPLEALACHFHDTRGTAIVNAYAAWQVGIRTFDGSIAGIGGCPYAPGAAGNAATEDLLNLFHRLGCTTGIDLDAAAETGQFMESVLGRVLPGRYHQYWLGALRRQARDQIPAKRA